RRAQDAQPPARHRRRPARERARHLPDRLDAARQRRHPQELLLGDHDPRRDLRRDRRLRDAALRSGAEAGGRVNGRRTMQRIGATAAAALLAGCANFGDMKSTVAQQDAADAFASAAFARMQTLAGNWKAEITNGPSDVPAATPLADGAPAAKPAAAETVNVEY